MLWPGASEPLRDLMSYWGSAPSSDWHKVSEEQTRALRETHSFSLPETVQSGWESTHFQDMGVPLPRALTGGTLPDDQKNKAVIIAPPQTPLQRFLLTVSTACRFCKTNQGQCECEGSGTTDCLLRGGNGMQPVPSSPWPHLSSQSWSR